MSKYVLENIIGKPVLGYRLPEFSFNIKNEWFYDLLIKYGFKYDSSILYKGFNVHYESIIKYNKLKGLTIFPINSPNILNFFIPCFGGTYFKLIPFQILKYFYRKDYHLYFHLRDIFKERTSKNIHFAKYMIHDNLQSLTLNKLQELLINENSNL